MEIYKKLIKELEDDRSMELITEFAGEEGEITGGFHRYLKEYLPVEQEADSGQPEEGRKTVREIFYPKERLIILGGGHIALPLAEFAAKTGFLVTVADDRPSFANPARFPEAEEVICDDFRKVIPRLKITRNDYIVIITRGHRHDMDCLREILKLPESVYLGMIGSRRRVKAVLELLREEGFEGERLERVCTPIGLSIGAVTPEEISISILAQLIARKRLGGRQRQQAATDSEHSVLKFLAENSREPMCLVTVIETRGSTPRGRGAKMAVLSTGAVVGSIGGGCAEAEIIHEAVALIGTGRYRLREIDMTGEVAESEGMVCGGIMRVLMEDCIL